MVRLESAAHCGTLKMNFMDTNGQLFGGMIDHPPLGTALTSIDSALPTVGQATVSPLSTLTLILFNQVPTLLSFQ